MFKAPTRLPHFQTLLDDTADARRVARYLDVTENTVKRWAKTGNAPRMASLALFWETRWGQSLLDCDAWNRDQIRIGLVASLQAKVATLEAKIAHLVELGNFGAANDPLFVNGVAPANGPVRLWPRAAGSGSAQHSDRYLRTLR